MYPGHSPAVGLENSPFAILARNSLGVIAFLLSDKFALKRAMRQRLCIKLLVKLVFHEEKALKVHGHRAKDDSVLTEALTFCPKVLQERY